MATIDTAFPYLYESGYRQALQQISARTRPYVTTTTVNGRSKRVQKLRKSTAVPITTRFGTTNPDELEIDYRSLFVSFWKDAKRVDAREALQLGQIGGPQVAIQQAQRMSMNRTFDQALINGLLGNAWEGENGQTPVALPGAQTIPVNFITGAPSGSGANTGLIFDKILRIREMFGAANIDGQSVEGGSNIVLLTTHRQLTDVLSTEKWTNKFYGNDGPLGTSGNVYSLLGMTIVALDPSLLPYDAATGIRTNIAYAKDYVLFGMAEDGKARVSELVDGNYDWQLYLEWGWGATRLYDEAVIRVLCDEII